MEMQILKCHQTAKRLPVQSTWQPSRKATLRRLLAFACLLVLASAASAQLRERTVASLDSARCVSGELQNKQFLVTDGISATDCLVGGGAIPAACVCDSGVFRALASGYVLLAGDADGQTIQGFTGSNKARVRLLENTFDAWAGTIAQSRIGMSATEAWFEFGDAEVDGSYRASVSAAGLALSTPSGGTSIRLLDGSLNLKSAQTPPTNATDTCVAGDTIDTATFHYYCHATNTWVRVAMATW